MIVVGAGESEDDFGFFWVDVISVISDYLLELFYSYSALLCVLIEVVFEVFSVAIVFDEGVFELVQFVHVDVLAFEFLGYTLCLLVEMVCII